MSYDPTIWDDKDVQRLLLAIVMTQNKEQAKSVLADILTPAEIKEITKRLAIAYYLRNGLSYDQIREKTRASTTTIASVSKSLAKGTGGYELVLSKIDTDFADHFVDHMAPSQD